MHIAFFGSSITSSYWNGAATYYRGLTRALAEARHRVTFLEPDALDRQNHRDLDLVDWVHSVVYPARTEADVIRAVRLAAGADVLVKCSGVGVHDALLEREVLRVAAEVPRRRRPIVAFLDVDAPATLERLASNEREPLRELVPCYDLILTYGGGEPVVRAYAGLGAKACVPVYNAADPRVHHAEDAVDDRFRCDLAFLGNRLPDREQRVREFFLNVAEQTPLCSFVIGGSGWEQRRLPRNVRHVGHVYVHEHNAFNASARLVLNISRDSMATTGFSPATRVFEAAAAGACIITDAWEGIDGFYRPDKEILVARTGDDVARLLVEVDPARARDIGDAARRRTLAQHTYAERARVMLRAFADVRRRRLAARMASGLAGASSGNLRRRAS